MPPLHVLHFEVFLQKLQAYPEDKIVMVLEGAGTHRNKSLRWPENIEGWWLPAYSPELNPVERWFKALSDRLANRIFETVEGIDTALTETLRPYWEMPKKLARLTGYPWWFESTPGVPTS